jgi:hypothetical protein
VAQSYVDNKQFMGSVLVASGDNVILAKGYGSANLEGNVPNTPATKFRIGSSPAALFLNNGAGGFDRRGYSTSRRITPASVAIHRCFSSGPAIMARCATAR